MEVLLKDRIKELRVEKKLTQADVARQLGVSRLTYIAIESGEKNPTVEQVDKISAVLGVDTQSLLFPKSEVAEELDKTAKYRQMCLACIKFGGDPIDGKITKTKLAKLLYLVDFAWYRKTGTSMSGLVYRALPRGPVVSEFFQMIDEMFESGDIAIQSSGAAMMISANEATFQRTLSDDEVALIQAVCNKWQKADTQTMVELTHGQAPWRETLPGMAISYQLANQIPEAELF